MRTIFRFIRTCFADFADLLFPTLCLGCKESLGANEIILCTRCRINLPETNQHRESNELPIINKFTGRVPIKFLASYLYYTKGGIAQKLIHSFKYKNQKEAAKEVARWYGHQLKSESNWVQEIDVLIGVPLHESRFRQRGFNQADWIAAGFSEAFNIPLRTDVLIRNRFEKSQTRKNRMERWENVKTVFAVQNPEEVNGKNVVLVDDVLTTGATLEACAIELLRAGSKSVSVLTLAATRR